MTDRGVPVRPVADRRRRGPSPAGLIGAALAFLVLAFVKPWGDAPIALDPGAGLRVRTAAPTASPTQDTSPEGLAVPICLGAGSWRIASLERWPEPVRVWRAVAPLDESVDAVRPDDPDIPFVPVIAMSVAELGWCAPVAGAERPVGPATVSAWRLDDGGPTRLVLVRSAPEQGDSAFGSLYRAPAPGPGGSAGWQPGRYVFRYVDAGAAGASRWFGVAIRLTEPFASPRPSASPSLSPAPDPRQTGPTTAPSTIDSDT